MAVRKGFLMRTRFITLVLVSTFSAAVPLVAQELPPAPAQQKLREPDIFYLPTPQPVVEAMLELAQVTGQDVIYDLGSGDGRIPITAAKKYGARGTGIDIQPKMVKQATENAIKEGVADKVTFVNADIYEYDFSDATVVTLYLLPALNEKLIPQLKKLKPGTRIVSHSFKMGHTGEAWPADKEQEVDGRMIYYWVVK
jgi:SAM-dependent methyltransferase